MRHVIGMFGMVLAAVACADGTAPVRAGAPVTVLYDDSAGRSAVVRTGQSPQLLPTLDTTSFFAAMDDGVVTFSRSRFSIYRFDDNELRPLEDRIEPSAALTPGAVSRDGRRLTYASARNLDRFLHTVDLTNGTRDSVNISNRDDLGAADQVVLSVPIWSPSGDSVAYLLQNVLGMQVIIFERTSHRVEQKVLAIPSSTYFQVQQGRPYWSADGTIRILARRSEVEPYRVLDTLVVLKIFVREPLPHTEVVSRAVAPKDMPMGALWSYSFSADGKAVAFGMSANGKAAIMVMRQGKQELETLLYGPGLRPRNILLIP